MKTLSLSILVGVSALILGSCNNKLKTSSHMAYEGKDISNEVEIIRDKQTKNATLYVKTDKNWKIYAGDKVETIDFLKPLLEGQGQGSFGLDIPTSQRYYFQFVTDDGKATLAEHHLPMEGGYNFRDLGGIKTTDGRFTKWGKIFRSDDLHNLTDNDLAYLSTIPIISVVDFRSPNEIDQAPDRNPLSAKNYPYTITPGNLPTSSQISAENMTMLKTMDIDSIMRNVNELLVTDSVSIHRYTDFFKLLEDESKTPLLFHCSAGKDRTGMGAALVLFSLGVDEQTVLNDYLLSNRYIKDKYVEYSSKYPELEPLFGVKPEYLKAGIKKIRDEYGSIDNYLDNVLKVNRDKLKEMYLY